MTRMVMDPREILRSKRPAQAAPAAPLSGTRAERVQRLQIGGLGLFAMILLVGLANIIMTSAQENQAASMPEDAPAPVTEDVPPPAQRDPLADAGVVPDVPIEVDEPEQQTEADVPAELFDLEEGEGVPPDVEAP